MKSKRKGQEKKQADSNRITGWRDLSDAIRVLRQDKKKKGGANRPRVFDRRDISEILAIPVALVRNWSVGKPYKISPSVRAPGKRGSANLYRLEDVYLFGIATQLSWQLKPELVKMVLERLQENPKLLEERQRRRSLVISIREFPVPFTDDLTGKTTILVKGGRILRTFTPAKLAKQWREFSPGFYFDLKNLLHVIDWQIERWEANRLYDQMKQQQISEREKEGKL